MRRLVAVLLLALLVPVAQAAAKPSRLRVSSVSQPPKRITAGEASRVFVSVANRRRKVSQALISLRLRRAARAYAVGARNVRRVRPRHRRRVRVGLRVPAGLRGRYRLVACVKRARDGRVDCRRAARRIRVLAPARPAPAPSPAIPATPTPAGDQVQYSSGARTLGDSLFPTIGNGGYDAEHYDLDYDYDPDTQFLRGTATATLKATQDLSDFSMDFVAYPTIDRVAVNGQDAGYSRPAGADKLVVTPAEPIRAGTTVTVATTFRSVMQPYTDPDGSQEGFIPSGDDRGAVVVSEPIGALDFFPCNDVPTDKATFRLRMAVPTVVAGTPWSVVATGVRSAPIVTAGNRTTYTWSASDPTAPYLFGVGIGKYDTATTTTAGGLPFTTAVDSAFTPAAKAEILGNLAETPGILDYYADYYGVPYPFAGLGGIVPLVDVGYSLETQTKPIYATTTDPTEIDAAPIDTVAHENGHMYFGDYVTLARWRDIWLNEGLTEFTSWLWLEDEDLGPTLDERYEDNYTDNDVGDFWLTPPADPPTAADIFDYYAMYVRGATVTYSLLRIMGDGDFRDLMRTWLTTHAYGNVTTEQLIALVKEEDAADQLRDGLPERSARWTEFFEQWLYTSYEDGDKPQITKDNFDAYPLP